VSILTSAASGGQSSDGADFWEEARPDRVGSRLAAARIAAGLTQAKLAERVGIRQNMVSYYERGKRSLSATMAERISEALGQDSDVDSRADSSDQSGVDPTLIAMFLKMSPEERLQANDNAVRGILELRNAYKEQR